MKVNIKNSSSIESNKLEIITSFIGFCQQNSPIKKVVEVVLVDFTSDEVFNGKFYFVVKNKSVKEILDYISSVWVDEFGKQRNVSVSSLEKELMVKFFMEKFPNYESLLYI
jgi:hypothetical protein